jgi:hypothetical protein
MASPPKVNQPKKWWIDYRADKPTLLGFIYIFLFLNTSDRMAEAFKNPCKAGQTICL